MRRDPQALDATLQAIGRQQLRRTRRIVESFPDDPLPGMRVVTDGGELVNFCGNDYLGLARDPRVIEALCAGAARFGVGSGAAHLVSGHSAAHHELEEELAAFTGRARALLFSTGYMANLGVIAALVGRGELLLEDRLNHASLIDAAMLCGARLTRYTHLSVVDARGRVGPQARPSLIASDGVFSMDGDLAPTRALADLAGEYDAWLLIDDAHGLGVLGRNGGGTLELQGLSADEVPLLIGTLGKGFGSFGAFVAGDADVIEYILQRARTYLFTTATPPALAAAALTAVRIAREETWRRERLQTLVRRFRTGAAAMGLQLADASRFAPADLFTPIQPIIVGSAGAALAASESLRRAGFWVAAIRPPTVPEGSSRLRVTLSAVHTDGQVDGLVDALASCLEVAA